MEQNFIYYQLGMIPYSLKDLKIYQKISNSLELEVRLALEAMLKSMNELVIEYSDDYFIYYHHYYQSTDFKKYVGQKQTFIKDKLNKLLKQESFSTEELNFIDHYWLAFKCLNIFSKYWFCLPTIYFSIDFLSPFSDRLYDLDFIQGGTSDPDSVPEYITQLQNEDPLAPSSHFLSQKEVLELEKVGIQNQVAEGDRKYEISLLNSIYNDALSDKSVIYMNWEF